MLGIIFLLLSLGLVFLGWYLPKAFEYKNTFVNTLGKAYIGAGIVAIIVILYLMIK